MLICKFCNAVCDNEWTQRVHHACCGGNPASKKGAIPYSLMPVIGELLCTENARLVDEALDGNVRNGGLLAEIATMRERLAALQQAAQPFVAVAGKCEEMRDDDLVIPRIPHKVAEYRALLRAIQ